MSTTNRYFIYLSYDGTNYCGWQIQPNGISVQESIEKALSVLYSNDITVIGAGRTDAGVHAKLMVAHFDAPEPVADLPQLVYKLNCLLPKDIVVSDVKAVSETAHARFSAISRTYQYFMATTITPFNRNFVWRYRGDLDYELMNRLCPVLKEYTDFTSFSKLHTDTKTNNCRIMKAEWTIEDDVHVFTIKADRFLRNMVRAIVGTFVEVGRGKIDEVGFRRIIEAKDRCQAGSSIPAKGLFLTDIVYPEDIFL